MSNMKAEPKGQHVEHLNGSANGSSSVDSISYEEHKGQAGHTQPVLAEHGPLVDRERPGEDEIPSNPDLWWSKVRAYCQDPFSEFFGVFIMILFGDGVVAQVVLSGGEKGSYQSITWGMLTLNHLLKFHY